MSWRKSAYGLSKECDCAEVSMVGGTLPCCTDTSRTRSMALDKGVPHTDESPRNFWVKARSSGLNSAIFMRLALYESELVTLGRRVWYCSVSVLYMMKLGTPSCKMGCEMGRVWR